MCTAASLVQLERDLGSVSGSQFSHDVTNVNLHRGFCETQFMGNDLVWLALGNGLGNRCLSFGEAELVTNAGFGAISSFNRFAQSDCR